jgi:hypothetical protein
MTRNYIPRNDAQFLEWVTAFLAYLTIAAGRLNFPPDRLQQLTVEVDDYGTKYHVSENSSTRTKLTIQARTTAREVLESDIRQSIQEYLAHNHLVTDVDRDGLGIPIPKKTRTPSPVAQKAPAMSLFTGTIRRVEIDFGDQDKSTESKAKPEGQHGAEFRWAILDTPPESLTQLINSSFDTKTPHILEFDENQRGKTVYIVACWENTRGEKGPWSDILKAVIP